MVDYGLKNKVAIITGTNNPQGIGATTALAFAREGAKVVLVYKKITRPFDPAKTGHNGVDRYYAANAGNADAVERKLQELQANYLILESDISSEEAVKEIYSKVLEKYGHEVIVMPHVFSGNSLPHLAAPDTGRARYPALHTARSGRRPPLTECTAQHFAPGKSPVLCW